MLMLIVKADIKLNKRIMKLVHLLLLYDIIEHIPPQEIHDISATKIREQMKKEGKL